MKMFLSVLLIIMLTVFICPPVNAGTYVIYPSKDAMCIR